MTVAYPDRIELARAPTPLERLERTGEALGVELWVKRDDLTGLELSGNKVRKLEFLLAEARASGADTVITCGGEQSNHCRATALAAAKLGLRSVLLLRTRDPQRPPQTTGNILLDRLAGAEIVWISPEQWTRRGERLEREAERARGDGHPPYVIPEGGSSALGCWGYVRAAEELGAQLAELPPRETTIIYACGSGGTGAGLILGRSMFGLDRAGVRIAGFNVCNDRDYFLEIIGSLCREVGAAYGAKADVGEGDIAIVDGYVGRGYAKSRPEELALVRELARREGLLVDPVYTGKAFYGMTRELERDPRRFGERVVFLHTGGAFGLFGAELGVE